MERKIGVIGLGYVGLPVAIALHASLKMLSVSTSIAGKLTH